MAHGNPNSAPLISLDPHYSAVGDLGSWIQQCSSHVAEYGMTYDAARTLGLINPNGLRMPDQVRADMWGAIATHFHTEVGFVPVNSPTHSATEDLHAALLCERFQVPVLDALGEHHHRAWDDMVWQYRGNERPDDAHIYLSTFVNACRRVLLARRLANERAANFKPARLNSIAEQLTMPGIPDATHTPEAVYLEVFANTATARAFEANTRMVLPTGQKPFTARPAAPGQRKRNNIYDIDRILTIRS